MQKRKNQSELSNVPRRHGDVAGRLNLIASATLAAYAAVAVGAGAGRAQVPNDDAVGISLNRAAIGETVRVALQGEVIDYDGWSWTPGPVYYTETTGELQQVGGVPVAVAITPTRLLITQTGELPTPTVLGAQPADATLTALAAFNDDGLVTQIAPDTFVARRLVEPASGFTISNDDGVDGNIIFALNGDLAALEALSGNGFVARTGTNTFVLRAVTGTANEVTVANGTGVSGAPTISLPSALTFTGKTVTGGTFNSGAFNGTLGATTPSTVAATTLTMSSTFLLEDSGVVDFTIRSLANTDVGIVLTDLSDSWKLGLDSSDGNAFVISSGTALGTNNVLRAAVAGSVYSLDIGNGVNTETVNLQLGNGRTGNGFSIIDLVGDATHTNFGLRLMRLDAGPNANSEILHRGTGALIFEAEDAGSVTLGTNNTTRLTVDSAGVVTIGANVSFDQTAANNENPTVSQFIVTNGSDGRHRKASASHAMQQARAVHVIASQAIATGASTTTINVPAGNWPYIDLEIYGLTAGSDFNPYLRVNSDSTVGNYRYAYISQNLNAGTTGTAFGGTAPGCINIFSTSTTVESTNGVYSCRIRIYNPASTTVRKIFRIEEAPAMAASDGVYYGIAGHASWLSTAAITTITLHLTNAGTQTLTGAGVNATAGTMLLVAPL